MRNENLRNLWIAVCMLAAFALWTASICLVDVRAIGPEESSVGFAALNGAIHNLTGVHMSLYIITDWLGLIPIGFAMGFALLGLVQWVGRKHIRAVDYSLFVLGGFYIVLMAAYVLFEIFVVNYRPILINGYLEASYPSSTTILVLCIMPTAIMQLHTRIRNSVLKCCVIFAMMTFIAFMVIGRLIAGVHWFTDIVGGVLLSTGLVMLYRYIIGLKREPR